MLGELFYIICFCGVSVLFRIFFRYHIEGRENITPYKTNGRPLVICSNHLSALDPVFIVMAYGVGKKLSIMGKAELFKNPVLAWMFRRVGCFPVERGSADRSALDKGIRDIKDGHGMLIFPEGTRGNGDEMLRIKSGAFMIAAETGADILPVRMIYPTKDRKNKFLGSVVVKFGKPLLAEDLDLTSGSKKALRRAKTELKTSFDNLLAEYNESVGYVPPEMPATQASEEDE